MNLTKKERTKTQSFGVSKREGHDATQFYSSRLYEGIPKEKKNCKIVDNSLLIDKNLLGQTVNFSELKQKLPEESLHLVIFIIPSRNINYRDQIEREDLLKEIRDIVKEIKILLINGGRLIVIIKNELREEFFPLHALIIPSIIEEDFLMRGDIILSANKDIAKKQKIEYIYDHAFIFSKNIFGRKKKDRKNLSEKTDTIEREEFLTQTKSIWKNKSSSSKNSMYDYIPQLLHLFSFKEDMIIIISKDKIKDLDELVDKIRPNRIISIF